MPRRDHSDRSTNASRKYHNRVARQYDVIYDDPYWEFHDEVTWRAIKPHLPRRADAPCLDLGCGTGKWGLRLLKSGFPTTFLDHSPAMVEETRRKVEAIGPKSRLATLLTGDIVDLSSLPSEHFELTLAMGDPLSICSDAARALAEMHRICRPGGIIIATADNKLAALEYFMERGDLEGLEEFVRTGRTRWLTAERDEQFELQTFTPAGLRKKFESAGFDLIALTGKTILPVRKHKNILNRPSAMEALLDIETALAREGSSAAAASHLQVIARRPATDSSELNSSASTAGSAGD